MIRVRSELNEVAHQDFLISLLDARSKVVLADTTSQKESWYSSDSFTIDYAALEPETEYVLRYEFYERELMSSLHKHQDSEGSSCRIPFLTQHLTLVDLEIVKLRLSKLENDIERDRFSGSTYLSVKDRGLDCDFTRFNNTFESPFGEEGVFCPLKQYQYSTEAVSRTGPQTVVYTHDF
jgi:hypothetical protein